MSSPPEPRPRLHHLPAALSLLAALALGAPRPSGASEFDRVVIDDDFPGAYQVEVADVDGDRRPDVVAVGGGTCAWYQNPSWKKRVVSGPRQTPGIISSASADLDGDGRAEIAIAYDFSMNEPTRGKLVLAAQGRGPDDPWTLTTVTDAGVVETVGKADGASPPADVRSIHRLRWGGVLGRPRASSAPTLQLVVAPIFGPSARPPAFDQEPAHVVVFDVGAEPKSGRWRSIPVGDAPVLHAIDVVKLDEVGPSTILAASNLGVTAFRRAEAAGLSRFVPERLAPGAAGKAPKIGASEVHVGRLKDGRRLLATVEPWHGTDVAVYLAEPRGPLKFGPRTVLDSSLKEGHALWVADVDRDGDDEVFAGDRGPATSVLMYDFDGQGWRRHVIDPAVAAQDLRGGDLDGDGTPDVVAVGGATHNVVLYRFRAAPRAPERPAP